MILAEYVKQPRGPYLFETWLWANTVRSTIGDLPLELYTSIHQCPNDAMVSLAEELASYASSHGEQLLDLIYGHYSQFKAQGWLSFWNVSADLGRSDVMSQVESVILSVHSDLVAGILINISWDQEHRLRLTYESGAIIEANDGEFEIKNDTLIFP
jgi:hypothetical protein